MKEITIEIRKNALSIQAANAAEKAEEIKEILKSALDALEKQPTETYGNELLYKTI